MSTRMHSAQNDPPTLALALRVISASLAWLLLACSAAPLQPKVEREAVGVFAPDPPTPTPEQPTAPPTASASNVPAAECVEPPPPAPACGSDLLRVSVSLAYHPRYAFPPGESRRELDQVAAAMRAHPGWQMLRVEVYSSQDPGTNTQSLRREMLQAQARADAIFGYLFHKQRISAERMDAIGYGYDPRQARDDVRWPVVLRLVHRLD
ncbi:MAG: hypothetical protein H6718_11150 [Polyangiaceae bacterium]|nr:hypothetical protein [Myxococcales bacterium]MCB9585946.1 hypothetical protein [Polyangiaceae bacterium]